jgi:hypothetical protein
MSDSPRSASEQLDTMDPEATRLVGLTVRAGVLAIIFTFLTYLVTNRLGFMWIVPPVPALMFLLILLGINAGLRVLYARSGNHWMLRPLERSELLLIYIAICIAPVMDRGVYVLHYLFYPIYYGNDVNQWHEFAQYYPSYFIPHDPRIATGFWEGSQSGLIPWDVLWQPVAWWLSFNMLIMVAVMCIVSFFRRQWSESERSFAIRSCGSGLASRRSTTSREWATNCTRPCPRSSTTCVWRRGLPTRRGAGYVR